MPEIELVNRTETKKWEEPRVVTGLDSYHSRKLRKDHLYRNDESYPIRKRISVGNYEVSWVVRYEQTIPIEGLVIRGLTKDQAEAFANFLKETAKVIKVDIMVREGKNGTHEVYTKESLQEREYNRAVRLFTEFFGEKPKHRARKTARAEPKPMYAKILHKVPDKESEIGYNWGNAEVMPIETIGEYLERNREADMLLHR